MFCRTCGSPVQIRGRQWECGWCGDFGMLSVPPAPQKITLSFSISCKINLSESWNDLKSTLAELKPDGTLEPLLGKVLLHEISAALRQLNAPPSAKKMQELERMQLIRHAIEVYDFLYKFVVRQTFEVVAVFEPLENQFRLILNILRKGELRPFLTDIHRSGLTPQS